MCVDTLRKGDNDDDDDDANNNNNNNKIISFLSPLCRAFTIIYLKQTLFLGHVLLQLFCIHSLCYM
jgi:hypothetical protein